MRIIAGQHKGRKLLGPPGRVTRPITDRVKSALFDTLAAWMPEARVADLFAGTGSMGIESLSRGADHVWFAERDRDALDRLKRNLADCGCEGRATIWTGDIYRKLPGWLGELSAPLDVVFLDPPYPDDARWLDDQSRTLLDAIASALAADGVVVFRTPKAVEVPEQFGPLELARRREYGSMAMHYIQHTDAP